jgi:hypothetical protein
MRLEMKRLGYRLAPLAFVAGVAITGAGFAASHHNNNNNGNSSQNGTKQQNSQKQTPPPSTPAPSSQPSQFMQDESAQSVAATALKKAQDNLKAVSDADWAKYAQTPEWTAAQTKLTSAQSDVDTAKQAASDALNNNPDYQAAVTAKKKAVDDLVAARAEDDASPEKLAPLATASLQATINLRKIQRDILANDTGVQTATDKLATAQHEADMLKLKFQQSLLTDKGYAAAKSAVDAAQRAYDDAHQKVLSASNGG